MTIEEVLVLVDTILKPRYLNQVQELVLRQSWEGRTYSEIAANHGYDAEYIKNVGFGLWQSLSERLGEKVSKSNFRSIVRRCSSQLANGSSIPAVIFSENSSVIEVEDDEVSVELNITLLDELQQMELPSEVSEPNFATTFINEKEIETDELCLRTSTSVSKEEMEKPKSDFSAIFTEQMTANSDNFTVTTLWENQVNGENSTRKSEIEQWIFANEKEWEKRRLGEREIKLKQGEPTERENGLTFLPNYHPESIYSQLPIGNYPPKLIINRRQDWEKEIDVSIFYGRSEEINILKQWLQLERCRLVALFGMGGIGKTSLSMKLAQTLADEFECLIWRSLWQAPSVTQLIGSWIQFINPQHGEDLPTDLDSCISQLIEYLQQYRCLLVIDDVEVILRRGARAGYYREGYENYQVLFKRLGSELHDSTILLTSREQPKELASLKGKKVRSLQLDGLSELAALEFFKEKGYLKGQEAECKQVIQLYQGNPLALKIISSTIQDLFDHNVAEFLAQGTAIFGDIRDLLDEQFERLSDLEKEIMYWLAVENHAISLAELRQNLSLPVLSSELLEALDSLKRRSLIENISGSFMQKPVIMEYMKNRLLGQIYQKKNMQESLPHNSYA